MRGTTVEIQLIVLVGGLEDVLMGRRRSRFTLGWLIMVRGEKRHEHQCQCEYREEEKATMGRMHRSERRTKSKSEGKNK